MNGIRAVVGRGFESWLRSARADVVGLQEVRAKDEDIPAALRAKRSFDTHFVAAERAGYSGVGLLHRDAPTSVATSLGEAAFDVEARVQLARFGRWTLANVYFPNGSGKDRDNGRVPYKLAFYRRLFEVLEEERAAGQRVVVMGDFNTAHRPIDLARPKANEKTSGFLPEERAELDRWIQAGYVDTFRHFDPAPGRYTWWSARFGVRERNIGWRIDYVLACPRAMPFVKGAAIHANVLGSDHCPISVALDPAIRTSR